MTVYVNGEACDVRDGTTVAELASARGADRRGCAVAVDGAVVPRGEWEHSTLSDGQRIEIVRAVQGG